MSAVASSSSDRLPTRTFLRRRSSTTLLLALGLALLLTATFLLSKIHRASAAPTLYAVEGKVLVDGEPAENLNVAFHPLTEGKNKFCPVGRTNNKGIFHLMTRTDADGAPAGDYRVTLVWPDGLVDECECPDPILHDQLRGSYAKADKSTFQVKVGSSTNKFWFNASRPPHQEASRPTPAEQFPFPRQSQSRLERRSNTPSRSLRERLDKGATNAAAPLTTARFFEHSSEHATITLMKAYETSTTVEPQGDIRVIGVPFAPGTEVEVTISPKRKSAAEFAEAWHRFTSGLRQLPQAGTISDDAIQQEIDDYRTG